MSQIGGVRPRRKGPPIPFWVKLLLVLFGVPLILGVVTWFVLDITTRAELEKALTAWKARGRPTDWRDLQRAPAWADENAALLYEQAFLLANFTGAERKLVDKVRLLDDFAALGEEERRALRAALGRHAGYLGLLRQAASLERCRFEVDFSPTYAVRLPHLLPLRDVTQALALASLLAAADGKLEEAVGFWLDSLGPTRLLKDPALKSQLLRIECFSISHKTLKSIVSMDGLSDEQLARMMAELRRVEFRKDFARALAGEAAFFLTYGQASPPQLPRLDRTVRGELVAWGWRMCRPWRQHDVATGLRLRNEWVELAGQPRHATQLQRRALSRRLGALDGWTPLSTMLLPAVSTDSVDETVTAAEARQATALVALALQRHRRAHEDYPSTLDALVPSSLPELPLDPFTGQPLRYIKTDEVIAVYSVGKNQTDDTIWEPLTFIGGLLSAGDIGVALGQPAREETSDRNSQGDE